ncbi:MAG: DUF3025 domain-containing protein [Gammaproteobacteria bacterium]|nr:DUF3025 domain-containing protein [Gammaproteobacteria bacterium]
MNDKARDIWNPYFFNSSPIFDPIKKVSKIHASSTDWPTLESLQTQFAVSDINIKPVPQGGKPETFEEHYEPRIYLKGELQTRTENWHDFFNAMVWLTFPETKNILNKLHFKAATNRNAGTNRSPLENAITLFDECGIIIISDDAYLLKLIRQHEWSGLFLQHRDKFFNHVQCIVFGHAIYEKNLAPYIGMTCQAILIHSDALLETAILKQYSTIDNCLADLWNKGAILTSRDLQPFPVLGVPGWHNKNSSADFYGNRDYFRPLKRR